MSIVWDRMVRELAPDYDKLTKIMNEGAEIVSRSITRPTGIDFMVVDESAVLLDYDPSEITKRVNWLETQLLTWPNCNRLTWDTWHFTTIESYRRFMTIYHLKWPT